MRDIIGGDKTLLGHNYWEGPRYYWDTIIGRGQDIIWTRLLGGDFTNTDI